MSVGRAEAKAIFARGFHMRCPRCGEGAIFNRVWTYSENKECVRCGLLFDPKGESLVFMYLSTAFLTGLWFIVLLVLPPKNLAVYRVFLVTGALSLYLVTMPVRKGLAVALNFFNSRD
jgi:uncharacterized protein (DUF983 family)